MDRRHRQRIVQPSSRLSRFHRRVIDADLAVVWWFRRGGRRLGLPFRYVISQRPFRDISTITWAVGALGVHFLGFRYGLICLLNLGACLFLRSIVKAKRPIDYDPALKQLADRGRENYGFPSVETHLAVVVYGGLFLSLNSIFLFAGFAVACVMISIVAVSRVVAGSRFVHQVVGSLVTGAIGLAYGKRTLRSLPDWKKSEELTKNKVHFILLTVVGVTFIAYLAYCAEANTSHFLSVPNSEFVRVLRAVYGLDHRRSRGQQQSQQPPDSLALLSTRLASQASQRKHVDRIGRRGPVV